jgi:hypothetical protein
MGKNGTMGPLEKLTPLTCQKICEEIPISKFCLKNPENSRKALLLKVFHITPDYPNHIFYCYNCIHERMARGGHRLPKVSLGV